MAKITVIKPGFYTSVQDLGRFGFGNLGVPVSGAMDQISFTLANHLLKNELNAACLEMTMTGVTLTFDQPTRIILCGANAQLSLNGHPQSLNRIIPIHAGDWLEIGPFHSGQRMYLGIKGGFLSQKVLNSRSYFKGITSQSQLGQGDSLSYHPYSLPEILGHAHVKPVDWAKADKYLKVYPGPEINKISEDTYDKLFKNEFTISPLQNRMGIQLEDLLSNGVKEILTAPVYPGTVQLTPSGKMIILMRDAQVTGGYPRILQLTDQSISVLSQKKSGQGVRFSLLEGEEG